MDFLIEINVRAIVSQGLARLPRGGLFARTGHGLAEVEAVRKDRFCLIRPIEERPATPARERMSLFAGAPGRLISINAGRHIRRKINVSFVIGWPGKGSVMNAPNRVGIAPTATVEARGMALLRDPLLNKGTAFTEQERDTLGLRGLLPAHVLSMEAQAKRVMTNLRRLPNDLEKYVALNALHDRNEALFFRIVCDNIDEIQPLIYTPTVGLACQRFGHIFQRPRGLFIGANDRGRIRRAPGQLAVCSKADRRNRRRAHSRSRRSRRQRHGNSGRQTLALCSLRRHSSEALPSGDARCRHQQRNVC